MSVFYYVILSPACNCLAWLEVDSLYMLRYCPVMKLALCVLCLLVGCRASVEDHSSEGAASVWYDEQRKLYYGIPVRVSFKPSNPELAKRLWQRLESIDLTCNDYRSDSEIAKINASPIGQYDLSEDLLSVLRASKQVAALTDNYFDITLGPLRNLWKQAAQEGRFPHPAEIKRVRLSLGVEQYSLTGNVLHKQHDEVRFDVGGIVKGWVIDELVKEIAGTDVDAALFQVGGETFCFGNSPRGTGHRLGIPHPLQPNDYYAVVTDPGTGLSACTSGNYRQPIIIEGKPYYHIFNPKSGKPAANHTLSVSVLFPEPGKNALADGLSTAGVLMPIEAFFPLVESLGGETMILRMDRQGKIIEYRSEGWERFVGP